MFAYFAKYQERLSWLPASMMVLVWRQSVIGHQMPLEH
jgi:hypothetical protein